MDVDERLSDEESSEAVATSNCSDMSSYVIQKNPLLIDTVLRCVFSFVDYETLVQGRTVCSHWKEVIDPMFIPKSVFVFDTIRKEIAQEMLENPPEMETLFESVNLERIQFTSFKFRLALLTTAVRQMYLEPSKALMTQLELVHSNKPRDFDDEDGCFDDLIGPNVKQLALTEGTAQQHDLLLHKEFTSRLFRGMCNNFTLKKLASISHLHLEGGTIIINSEEVKIAPEELKLVDCYEKRDGEISLLKMNAIFDFRKLQKLHLNFHESVLAGRVPTLNLSDCTTVKQLYLRNMILNCDAKISPQELTLWNNRYKFNGLHIVLPALLNDILNSDNMIGKLTLDDKTIMVDFGRALSVEELIIISAQIKNSNDLRSPSPRIKKLEIDNHYAYLRNSELDLNCFPVSIERLHIKCHSGSRVTSSSLGNKIFPHLQQLLVDNNASTILPYFSKESSINEVVLGGRLTPSMVHNLPLFVERLRVTEFSTDLTESLLDKLPNLDLFVISELTVSGYRSGLSLGNTPMYFVCGEVGRICEFQQKFSTKNIAVGFSLLEGGNICQHSILEGLRGNGNVIVSI